MEPAKQPKRFHYAWVIFAICFLSVFTSLGFCSSPKSLFLAAITEDLGIPRSLFSIGNSCRFITTAVINLFFGKLVAKFGPRKLIAAGFTCLTLSNLIGAVSNGIFGFYISNVFLGLGLAWSTTSLVGIVVEKWFTSSKGTVMGFILAANGLGGAISSQVLSRIIYAKADGWRTAYVVAAVIMVVVGLIIVLLMRKTFFRSRTEHRHRKHWGYLIFANVAGRILDAFVFLLNLTFYRSHPIRIDFVYVLAARVYDHDPEFARATRTVSFGLLLFALGFLVALVYLILL